jgi:hypothetical protein
VPQGIAHNHRVYASPSHLPLQAVAEIVPAAHLDTQGCGYRMQFTVAGVPQIQRFARPPMQNPLRSRSQLAQAFEQFGVDDGVQGIALFFLQRYHFPVVNHPPDMQHVLGIEIRRLQTNRRFAPHPHRRQQ